MAYVIETKLKDIKISLKENFESQENVKDDIKSVDEKILRPFTYLTSTPGKNIRKILLAAINYWLEAPRDKLEMITEIVSDFHSLSLLIDDIQDRSILRRGIPTAHSVYGITNTVLAADYVLLSAIEKLSVLNHPEAMRVYMDTKVKVLAGQGMDLYWRDRSTCPTEEEYLQMITRKTGGVFFLGKNLLQLFSKTNKDVDKFLITVGLYFQINDDYQNLHSEVLFTNKGFCEDITEGKFGFPIVHAVNTHSKEAKMIMNILHQKTYDVAAKKYCLSLIEACGSFEYTRNKIKELKNTMFEEIKKLGRNPYFNEFLEKMVSS